MNGVTTIRIFICEDNKFQRNKVCEEIRQVGKQNNIDLEIVLETDSPKELIDYVSKNRDIGVYFLDVDLNDDINGIMLAAEIRKYDPMGVIIFITAHIEMSYLTFIYKIEAMDYITKEDYRNLNKRIRECLLKAKKKLNNVDVKSNNTFTIKSYDRVISMDFDEIVFFETSSNMHKIVMHTENRQVEFYGRLKEIEKNLNDNFYRSHKSYIVNKNKIKEIDTKNKIIHMNNGEKCFVSLKLMSELIKNIS